MVTTLRDRIQAMIKKGMSIEHIKAARPTRDYDPRHNATNGPWKIDKLRREFARFLLPVLRPPLSGPA